MIVQKNNPAYWPDATAYVRWRQRLMDQLEQHKFFDCLYSFALRIGHHHFCKQFPKEDIEDFAMDAVMAHTETYLAEKGDARAHLFEIFRNKARSALRRASRQRETLGEDISDEWINLRFDTASDTSCSLLEVEGIEQKQLLLHIWKNWDELPNYPWKDTLRMYFDWMFFTDCSNESRIGEFIKHCSRSGILDKPEATIYRHVANGKAELAKWLHAGESPLSVQDRPKIAMKCGIEE